MPTLHWVGKDKVVNHHHDVPFRVLNKVSTFTAPSGTPANSTDNRIIHGDNLEALKSLLPEFEGRVKCIYIDPPYNTGNEGWVYNDAVNDPKMKRWLGQVVGKEGEDLSRHDKWLCMMYPRLKLLHRLLSNDGAIFVSIDDNEAANLRLVMNEIFGHGNFLCSFAWEKRYSPPPDTKDFGYLHETLLAYRKTAAFVRNLLPLTDDQTARYRNLDDDPRGPWKSMDYTCRYTADERPNLYYGINHPTTGKLVFPKRTRVWGMSREVHEMNVKEKRLWWGIDGKNSVPALKNFLTDIRQGMMPVTLLKHEVVGHTDEAAKELRALIPDIKFTPKPVRLIRHLLQIAASKDALVLDSFAGSGTTAHAVLELNLLDGGKRRFILAEVMDYASTLTAERIKRAIGGLADTPLGGGFDYYTIGEPLFLPDDNLNEAVGTEAIRNYVAYSEGIPAEARKAADNPHSPYLLGLNRETAWLFHYEPARATSLDMDFLASLRFGGHTGASKPATAIIYADRCLLSKEFMSRHGIIFKKIPRDITRF